MGLALALGLLAGSAIAGVVDPATAQRAVEDPAVIALDAELSALAHARRATELAARLESIARDPALADVAGEWLLDRGLHALARIAPSPAARAAVSRLALRAPTVYARVDPDHGERTTPLYDTGATARFVLRSWTRAEARGRARAELDSGSAAPVGRYASLALEDAADPRLAGIADAFREAPATALALQRPVVAGALAAGQRVDALALILAERLRDPPLFDLLFDEADGLTALAAVPAVARALDVRSALEALARASRRADVGSAALLEIARLAKADATAQQILFDALADPARGPSAAAALGRLADPAVSAELGRRLAAAKSEPDRRLLVLALKLDASPAARAELERFARASAGSASLRKEVRAWLAP
jgi:hypothetical protein